MIWTVTHEDLFKKVNWEMDAYARSMWDRSSSEVYDRADEIAAMRQCYNHLIGNLGSYSAEELEPLLREEKPLETVCQRWMSEQDYDPSELFDRVLRSCGVPRESEMRTDEPAMG